MFSFPYLKAQLQTRAVLSTLFICNLLGTIYGFYWYKDQLAATAWYWDFFVPDSPTSSLFFTWVLMLWLMNKRAWPWLEMMSMVTNLQYGIWACGVILTYDLADRTLVPEDVMLFVSHGAMAVEVILYNFLYRFDWRVLWIGAVWLLYNDFVDYVYGIHPWLEDNRFLHPIAFGTPLLTVATLIAVACLRPKTSLPEPV